VKDKPFIPSFVDSSRVCPILPFFL